MAEGGRSAGVRDEEASRKPIEISNNGRETQVTTQASNQELNTTVQIMNVDYL
jgi:hypothetical protein